MIGDDLLRERAQTVADIEAHRGQAATKVVTRPVDKPDAFATVVEARLGRQPKRRTVTVLAAVAALLATATVSAMLARRTEPRSAPRPWSPASGPNRPLLPRQRFRSPSSLPPHRLPLPPSQARPPRLRGRRPVGPRPRCRDRKHPNQRQKRTPAPRRLPSMPTATSTTS